MRNIRYSDLDISSILDRMHKAGENLDSEPIDNEIETAVGLTTKLKATV